MTRDEVVTELAMKMEHKVFGVDRVTYPSREEVFSNSEEVFIIRHQEYLDRRRELINEPDDADAPEWARFKAQDAGGDWYWYEFEPGRTENSHWHKKRTAERDQFATNGKIPAGHEWRETLKAVERELSAPE